MMSMEEIKKDLLKFVKMYYDSSEVMYLDLYKKEVELRFHIQDEDRYEMERFYENNRHVFMEDTIDTTMDLQTIEDVSIRVDSDGIYFGKSSYDLLATNVAAFYLLEKYLNDLMEALPDKLKVYSAHQIIQ